MVLAIIYSIFFIFCILGIAELLFTVKILFFGNGKKSRYLLLFLKEDEYYSQLCCAIEKMNWYGNIYDKILAVTDYIDEAALDDCKRIAEYYNNQNVFLLNKKDITEII